MIYTDSISNTMRKAITKQLFRRIFSYGCRKSWYAGEWSKPVPMAKSAQTAATTALHRLSFAANAVKCSAEFTGTIAAANPSSGAASVDWSQPITILEMDSGAKLKFSINFGEVDDEDRAAYFDFLITT